jgi:hypothetical protein
VAQGLQFRKGMKFKAKKLGLGFLRSVNCLTFFVTWLCASLALAGNAHEHLQTLFSIDDFKPIFSHILNPSGPQAPTAFKVDKLFKSLNQYQQILNLYPIESKLKAQLVKDYHELTLAQVFRQLPGDPQKNLEFSLSMPEQKPESSKASRKAFSRAFAMRSALISNLSTDDLLTVFLHYLNTTSLEERDFLNLSIPFSYAQDQQDVLTQMQNLAKSRGTHLRFMLSLTRKGLLIQSDVFTKLQALTSLAEAGQLQGVDITQSLFEDGDHSEVPESLEQYKSSLWLLFTLAHQFNIPLQIHAFEASNSGPFYSALEHVIKNFDKSMLLWVAHVNRLDARWIQILRSNPQLAVTAEVNLESNVQLQGADPLSIIEIVKRLREASITTLLGTDGRGIFPRASIFQQENSMKSLSVLKKKTSVLSCPQIL